MRVNPRIVVPVWLVALALTGCAAGEEGGGEAPPAGAVPTAERPAVPPEGGPTDGPALAARGEALFTSLGCVACHAISGGRLVGPDLAGVTRKRDEAYILAMITNPDSMLIADPTAKQLLAEYYTPMPNQGVSRADAEALLAYLRREDAGSGG